MKSILFVLVFSLSNKLLAEVNVPDVIYGSDSRHEIYNYTDPNIAELAKSTVALVRKSKLVRGDSISTLLSVNFEASAELCSTERFKDQPTGAFCSGFLIAPNKIFTAGHCIENMTDCENTRFVFDYVMTDSNNARTSFSSSQIYSCKKILGRKEESKGLDFGVIELDRNVENRIPLKLSKNVYPKIGMKVFAIGHPAGLPAKITDDAKVRAVYSSRGYFVANLDTYGGNSGSAVFNEKTLEVEGILVRGEKDYEISSNLCNDSYQIGEDDGRGEDVTLISEVVENGEFETETSSSEGLRYVYLSSDSTCNEFRGSSYIREVSLSFCTNASATRYVYLSSDNTCNEFRGSSYIREVSLSLCSDAPATRYVYLSSDDTCNEFRGNNYIREVEMRFCSRD